MSLQIKFLKLINPGFLEETKLRQLLIYVILVCLIIAGVIISPIFVTSRNVINVCRQSVALGLVGIGQTFVILVGGLDLSVGTTISLTSCLAAGIMNNNENMIFPVILITLLVGSVIGLTNGILISYLKIPPLIATFGIMYLIQGLTLLYSHFPVPGIAYNFMFFSEGYIGPFPFAIIFFGALFVVGWFILRKTVVGRYIYAVGEDKDIAYLSGINITTVTLITFFICGITAALCGLFLASRCGSGDPLLGAGYEFDSITAVLLGGTSLVGGKGGLIGTLAGVFVLSILNNILNLVGIHTYWQWLIKGALLIIVLSTYKIKEI